MDSNNAIALTIWILLVLVYHRCDASVNYDITECQECSTKNLIPCKIQGMHDNCLSAKTVVHEKQWPGPPRQLIAEEVLTENESHAWFSWKPPYDASIHSLKGFLLRITHYEDNKGGFVSGNPWCFYLNLTDKSWADFPHAYESSFHFNCIKSKHPAKVTLSVSSIPRPHEDWKVIKQSVYLQGTVPFYQWRPNVSVSDLDDSVGSCVVVAVHPPFPNAFKHGVYAQLDHRPVKQFFFYYPNNNVTLCLTPDGNYTIQVKPYDKDNHSLSHFVQYSPIRIESKPIQLLAPDQGDELQVITWVVIPLVLVIAISLTVFVFYRKGMLGMLQKMTADSNIPPNNMTDEEVLTVAIVFCSENNYVENVVCSLGKIIREITGSQVELISDGRMIEPNRILLFVVTEGIHQINHVYMEGNCKSNRAFSSGQAFLQRFFALKDVQPLMLLLSPIVSMNWLDCCIFKNKNVPVLYHISDSEQLQFDFAKMTSLLDSICQNDKFREKIRSNMENNQEILNLTNHLFVLYLYMRDNQSWFEEDFLGCSTEEDVHQTQPLLPYSISQGNDHLLHLQCNEKVCLNNQSPLENIEPHQVITQVNYYPPKIPMSNGQVEKGVPKNGPVVDPDVFDSGISEQDMKLEINTKSDGRLDSGVDSIPLDEMSPFLVGSPDFLPPDSDTDSLDIDAQSLGQHMLEINKRNLQVW